MDDIVELIVDIIGGILEGIIDTTYYSNNSTNKKVKNLKNTSKQVSYVSGLFATALALFYSNDKKLDSRERKMFKQITKQHKHEMSNEMKYNFKYIYKRRKYLQLNDIYQKLELDKDTILSIIYELKNMLSRLEKNIPKFDKFLNDVQNQYNPVAVNY